MSIVLSLRNSVLWNWQPSFMLTQHLALLNYIYHSLVSSTRVLRQKERTLKQKSKKKARVYLEFGFQSNTPSLVPFSINQKQVSRPSHRSEKGITQGCEHHQDHQDPFHRLSKTVFSFSFNDSIPSSNKIHSLSINPQISSYNSISSKSSVWALP